MKKVAHPLVSPSCGTRRELVSLHFGSENRNALRVYMQASLHADELPGALALWHLRGLLQTAEDQGHIQGTIVLVPLANPIGLDQTVHYCHMGRFALADRENFNRHFPDFPALCGGQLADALSDDAESNKRSIRQRLAKEIAALPRDTELACLRATLLQLAFDADIALDLHCDYEAVLHLYTEQAYLQQAGLLARCLGAEAILWANGSGGNSFDECLSEIWWRLREKTTKPVPPGCFSATVELRGQAQVDDATAGADAARLFGYLQHLGVIGGEPPGVSPQSVRTAPLAGVDRLLAPHPGIVAFTKQPGDSITTGEKVADIVDPLAATQTPLCAHVDGLLFARQNQRYATTGMEIARIAGEKPLRGGYLLGP